MSDKQTETIEFDEVLPPDPGRGGEPVREGGRRIEHGGDEAPLSRLLAYILDDCIQIPGTKIRIGLDPILGLFPGIGDILASVVGTTIIGEASKRGASKWLQVRMAGNVLINAAIGAVPVFGDLFSAWFKSNARNYNLMVKHLGRDGGSEADGAGAPVTGRWFGYLVIASVVGVAAVCAWAAVELVRRALF